MEVQGVVAYIITMFAGAAIGELLSDADTVNIAMHMMIVDLTTPEFVTNIVNILMELLTFDILPVENVYDWFVGRDPVPPNAAFE